MLAPAQHFSSDHTSLGELVDAFVGHSLVSLLTAERAILKPNGASTGVPLDVDAVHRFRVAARRLRSTLGTYRGCWPRETRRMLRDELRAVGRAAGAVRDADVLAERFRAHALRLDDVDRPALERLLERLHAERAEAHAALQRALASPHHAAFRASFGALVFGANEPNESRGLADSPPGVAAGVSSSGYVPIDTGRDVVRAQRRRARPARRAKKRVRANWRELRRAVRGVQRALDSATIDSLDAPTDATFHALRILAKRCRYAAESVAPLVGPRAMRLAHAVADVQSILGEHQDTVAAEAWLRLAVSDTASANATRSGAASTELVLLTGELIGLERVERARCRAAFHVVWERAQHAASKAERRWL